jgi:glycosyltransferase involved in cell wall biosynthesis
VHGVSLTIVIPAFNEAERLPATLAALRDVLEESPELGVTEVLVVDDGSTDATHEVGLRALSEFPLARMLRLPWNCGKGAAVRAGVAVSQGEALIFMDADLATDLSHIHSAVDLLKDHDVVLGSRSAPGASVRGRTFARRVGGDLYHRLARQASATSFTDTQCGFKAFRSAEAKVIFSLIRSTGFGFDVEVCTIAAGMGLRIAELPISWTGMDGGTFRMSTHGTEMLADLWRARRQQRRAASRAVDVSQVVTLVKLPVPPLESVGHGQVRHLPPPRRVPA